MIGLPLRQEDQRVATEAEDLKVRQENEAVRGIKGDYKYGWHDDVACLTTSST